MVAWNNFKENGDENVGKEEWKPWAINFKTLAHSYL